MPFKYKCVKYFFLFIFIDFNKDFAFKLNSPKNKQFQTKNIQNHSKLNSKKSYSLK